MTPSEIEKLFRDEAGRALATLIRLVGDFDLAQDALQDAFAVALERWPDEDPPSNPRAWLVNVGRNKAIDRVRRRIAFRGKQDQLTHEIELNASVADETDQSSTFDDDMLRLIFTCCHPAFAAEVQVALTLRTVCGLTTAQAARAFLISEEAMAQRLLRAKQKIRLAGIPYEVPEREALEPRLNGVLAVIYLVFTEGYVATSGDGLMRPDLAREAIRLGRLLNMLVPGRGEIKGLLARGGRAAKPLPATSCCWKSRIARCGIITRSPKACSSWKKRCGCREGRNPMRCRPRSRHCTRGPRTTGTLTGGRSRGSTRCCYGSARSR
jgi:RNA polymerase sigma-70 factor (ECF subfamily)